jgi:hypothetical protein
MVGSGRRNLYYVVWKLGSLMVKGKIRKKKLRWKKVGTEWKKEVGMKQTEEDWVGRQEEVRGGREGGRDGSFKTPWVDMWGEIATLVKGKPRSGWRKREVVGWMAVDGSGARDVIKMFVERRRKRFKQLGIVCQKLLPWILFERLRSNEWKRTEH